MKTDVVADKVTETILIEFDVSTVLGKLSSLKIDKSPGPGGIHPMFLNKTASVLAKPVTALFAKSYQEGTIPIDWSLTLISPIFKKGSKDRAENYRPISLTSVLCKVMESRDKEMIFLSDRKMRVQVNGSLCGWMEVLSGFPQESVLGPLLFHLYVNDLLNWVKANIKMFADDTKQLARMQR